jgi:hypothetical protein
LNSNARTSHQIATRRNCPQAARQSVARQHRGKERAGVRMGHLCFFQRPRAAGAIQTPAQQLAEELRPQYIVNWPIDECIAHLLEIARRAGPLSDDDERAVRAAIRNCEVASRPKPVPNVRGELNRSLRDHPGFAGIANTPRAMRILEIVAERLPPGAAAS